MDDPKPLEPPTNAQPLTSNSVAKIVHEQLESERKWLDAAQNWAKEDRANFKILFDRTYWFIAVIVAVVGIAGTILGLNSLQQIQKQALETAHAEVHRRLAEEFQTEKVQALVRSAAKERLEIVATPIIRDEVASALKERTSQLETAYQNVNKLLNEYQRKSDEINERLRQTAPRILTADNAKRLTGRLLLRKGIPVSVSIGVDEGEVRRYAMQIRKAMIDGGWEVGPLSHYTGTLVTGVRIFVPDEQNPPQEILYLRSAFDAVGVRASIEQADERNRQVLIIVGPKP